MGYTDVGVRVSVDMLGPSYVVTGPTVLQHPTILYDIHTGLGHALACSQAPNSPVFYAQGMPWCTTRPLRVREQIFVFGFCYINCCATSLVQGSVMAAISVQCIAQHAKPCSTAQWTYGKDTQFYSRYSTYTKHCTSTNGGPGQMIGLDNIVR